MTPGPPPKDPAARRRRNAPAAGEWLELPASLPFPVLPALPRRAAGEGPWAPRTIASWQAWRSEPATSQYGPADVQAAIDLASLHTLWMRAPTAALAAEVRVRMDGLGLTPKGRQALRWRRGQEVPAEVDERPQGLRLVEMRERANRAGGA